MVFWTEVITGLIILNGLFGWMDLLIFIKWFTPYNPYSVNTEMMDKINQAPSIITVMINNFLAMGKQPFILTNGTTIDVYLFDSQRAISETLVIIVIVMMPIMLFVKPCSAICCPIYSNMPEYAKPEDLEAAGLSAHGHAASNPNGNEMDQIDTKTGGDPEVQADIAAYQEILNAEQEGGHNIDLNELGIH